MKVNIRFLFLLLLSILIFQSCITNSDLEYIQSNNKVKLDNEKVNTQDYRLQVGDLLSVQIITTTEQQHDFFNKESSLSTQLMVQNPYMYGYLIKTDGNLDLPSLGVVKAEGFTLRELENIIKQIARSYFEQPVVKLSIVNFEVSVLGEVNNPGTFTIINPKLNILYALSLAGDINQFGNRSQVKVIRNENKLNRVFYVDLTDQEILNDVDFMLHPNDIIYVAPLNKRFYAFNNITSVVSMGLSAVTLYLLIKRD